MSDATGRRDFLKGTAAAAALTAGLARADSTAPRTGEPIPVRVLGKTCVKLPVLGFGGAALPKLWGNPLSHEARVELIRHAYDRGIRFFDTAGNYMESQSLLGEGLDGVRKDVYLVTKVETTDPAKVRGAVEKSLAELRTDHLDAILIHGAPGVEQMTVAQAMKIHAELAKLRDEKITRHVGLSAHSYFDKALALVASGGFEVCLLSYGYIPRGYNQIWSAGMTELRNACVAEARRQGMGIVAMKVIGAGLLGAWAGSVVPGFDKRRLEQLPGAAIRYALDDDRIDLLAIGMRLKAEVDANVKAVSGDTTYRAEDRSLLAEYCAKAYESDVIKKMKVE